MLVVAFLCARVKYSTVEDRSKLDRLLKYLNGTVDQVLVLQPTKDLSVKGYTYAAFESHDDGKSHTGLVVKVGGATVLCMSSKQKIVTRDFTEAELVGLSDRMLPVMQFQEFMQGQRYGVQTPEIFQDNTSTISLVTKGGGQVRTKYMRVRQAFVKERAEAKDVIINYLESGSMIADILTKPLQGNLFKVMVQGITGSM